MKTDLSTYDNSFYKPGKNSLLRLLWFFCNALIFKTSLIPINGVKVFILRLFGAKMGKGVVIKPCVNIKYPWRLTIGDNTWIGEGVWIDNLDQVEIGNNCCISQGALILSGNHNYKKSSFNLMVKPILFEEGVWIGAKAIVCGGSICRSHSVITVGSVVSSTLSPYKIYGGNPLKEIKDRIIE